VKGQVRDMKDGRGTGLPYVDMKNGCSAKEKSPLLKHVRTIAKKHPKESCAISVTDFDTEAPSAAMLSMEAPLPKSEKFGVISSPPKNRFPDSLLFILGIDRCPHSPIGSTSFCLLHCKKNEPVWAEEKKSAEGGLH
jgi:hypothetical protein